jgi:hypothetical protein
MAEIEIAALEQGTTRLFALSLSDGAARQLRDDPEAQARALGLSGINSDGVEVFPVSDLGEMGLAGYLSEGVDARAEDLRRDKQKLASLDGWVMLVHSSAFEGRAERLRPGPELTLIGTYAQEAPRPTEEVIESAAAQPYTGAPTVTPRVAPRGRAGSATAVIGVLVLLGLLVWWIIG